MIEIRLAFNTVAEAQEALAKLNPVGRPAATKVEKTETKDQVSAAPAPPAPAAPAAPAPPAPAAPAAPAPPAAPAAPAPPAPAAPPVTVTAQQVNDAAVAKATAMGDQGAGVMEIIRSYGVTGLAQLPQDKLGEVLERINSLGG